MENRFNIISDRIFIQLNEGEYLTLSFQVRILNLFDLVNQRFDKQDWLMMLH